MPNLTKLDAFDPRSGDVQVVVETPRGSRNKYKYDDRRRVFEVKTLLPVGMTFPYDFGFVPSTRGDDGDPLDVLVLMEDPAPGGVVVSARLVGVIEAEQTEDGRTERNDRLIAVSSVSQRHRDVTTLEQLGDGLLEEIEHFFVAYNEMHGKRFRPIGRHGPERARQLSAEGEARFRGKASKKTKARAKK